MRATILCCLNGTKDGYWLTLINNKMIEKLKKINLTEVFETDDNTDLQGELACSGGSCELK